LKSSILKIEIKNVVSKKVIYLPILNLFDVNYIFNGNNVLMFENQLALELESNKNLLITEMGFFNIYV